MIFMFASEQALPQELDVDLLGTPGLQNHSMFVKIWVKLTKLNSLNGSICGQLKKLLSTYQDVWCLAHTRNIKWLENQGRQKMISMESQEKMGNVMGMSIESDNNFIYKCRYFYFGFYYPSTDVKVMKENLVYPSISLISELGGSFGLFVGFSFLTFFDFFTYSYEKFRTLHNRNYW